MRQMARRGRSTAFRDERNSSALDREFELEGLAGLDDDGARDLEARLLAHQQHLVLTLEQGQRRLERRQPPALAVDEQLDLRSSDDGERAVLELDLVAHHRSG